MLLASCASMDSSFQDKYSCGKLRLWDAALVCAGDYGVDERDDANMKFITGWKKFARDSKGFVLPHGSQIAVRLTVTVFDAEPQGQSGIKVKAEVEEQQFLGSQGIKSKRVSSDGTYEKMFLESVRTQLSK